MRSLVGFLLPNPEVGVATSSGRAYYKISSLLKRIGLAYTDIVLNEPLTRAKGHIVPVNSAADHNFKVIITTRKERLQIPNGNVICVEDLGDDVGLAKERLFSILYPPRPSDWFIIGIDPGERSGIAAFFNHMEIETSVSNTLEEALARVCALIDNAPGMRKIVKIGSGNLKLAKSIAGDIESKYRGQVKISIVDERGTSVLKRRNDSEGTRDQRAARLIAFREGRDYV